VQDLINQSPMKEHVQFVSITTDPSRDTPDVLRDYGRAHKFDPVNWEFLLSPFVPRA
jgi:protein SCO1